MTIRRISVLLTLFVCVTATAAETAQPNPPVSDRPVTSDTATPKADASKPVADATKPPAKPESTGAKTKDGDFKPSEEISEDMAVAYPVDI